MPELPDIDTDPNTGNDHVCLTLLVPESMQDRLVDWLVDRPQWQVEFGSRSVAMRGGRTRLAQDEEMVAGFALKTEFTMVLARNLLDPLLAELAPMLEGVDSHYTVQQLERFASFGRRAAEAAEVRR